ncbi:MAG: hypothetical protein AAGD01_12610 [Acidobacteriota bacterium]
MTTTTYPLVAVPGLFGSKLYYFATPVKGPFDVWPTDDPSVAEYLACDSSGAPLYSEVKVTGIDGYDKMFLWLKEKGYSEDDGNLVKAPYDWRLDLETVVGSDTSDDLISGQPPLAKTISDAAGSSKVDILCHSMGCLATMTYLKNYGFDKIHRIIFLAPPLLGTVESYYRLVCGAGPSAAKNIGNEEWAELFSNMQGVYQIGPGQELTSLLGGSFVEVIYNWGSTTVDAKLDFQGAYNLSDDSAVKYIKSMNLDLLQAAGSWRESVDTWLDGSGNQIDDFGYLLYGVIDDSTISGIAPYYYTESSSVLPDSTGIYRATGDQNVLTAGLADLAALGHYQFDDCDHMEMANCKLTIDTAVSILQGNPPSQTTFTCDDDACGKID